MDNTEEKSVEKCGCTKILNQVDPIYILKLEIK